MYCDRASVRASRNAVVLCMPERRLSSASDSEASPTSKASIRESARLTATTPPSCSTGSSLAALRMLHHGSLCGTVLYAVQRAPTVLPKGRTLAPCPTGDKPVQLYRRFFLTLAAASALVAGVHAETWPSRPIRLVVPFPAGGGTDIIARELSNKVATSGYTIVVDNKPGSGGNLGVDAAAK